MPDAEVSWSLPEVNGVAAGAAGDTSNLQAQCQLHGLASRQRYHGIRSAPAAARTVGGTGRMQESSTKLAGQRGAQDWSGRYFFSLYQRVRSLMSSSAAALALLPSACARASSISRASRSSTAWFSGGGAFWLSADAVAGLGLLSAARGLSRKCCSTSVPPPLRIKARSTMFSSSRTLPGQS